MDPKNTALPVQGRVLVVDDEARNRELLRDLLAAQGYAVTEAEDGARVLAMVPSLEPHVILLDVMMPGIDGFEVCRELKTNPATAPIPVILVTALHERADRLYGIECGANDFLSKPVDTREVVLRTHNAVLTKQLYDQVKSALSELEKLEKLRDDLTSMIVHDMRSPLQGITGNLQALEFSASPNLSADDQGSLQDALSSSRRLVEMVSSLLDVSRMEAGQMPLFREACDLKQIAMDAVKWLGGAFHNRPVTIEASAEDGLAACDKNLIQRVIANLLGNAAKYSPAGAPIHVVITPDDGGFKVAVRDRGPGIPPEYHAKIFDKFSQVESGAQRKKHSTGLGLTFCKLAVEAHGGRIGVDSAPGRGSTFWFTLPKG